MDSKYFKWTHKNDSDLKIIMECGININKNLRARFPSITTKRCRERYHYYLAPYITKKELTYNDKLYIINNARRFHHKWAYLGKKMGVSCNVIKNFYHSNNRKQISFFNRDTTLAGLRKKNGINKSPELSNFAILCDVAERLYLKMKYKN